MGKKCFKHPENDGKYLCRRHKKYLCDECRIKCLEPACRCQYRVDCEIWKIYDDV